MALRCFFFIFTALLIFTVIDGKSAAESPALTKHPIYSTYDFGRDKKIIDVATQPFYIPSGVIGQVMKRDRILRTELKTKGWEVRFHSFMKGSDINYFIERGDIDAAMAGDIPAVTAAAAPDIIIIALAQQGFTTLISDRGMQMRELKNKRIGYPAASTAHYAFFKGMSFTDIKADDVLMIPYEITDLAEALAQRKIDAFVSWEPVTSMALKKHTGFTVVQKCLSAGYLYMKRSIAPGHQDLAEILAASFLRALAWMTEDRKNLIAASEWTLMAEEVLHGQQVDLPAGRIADIVRDDILNLTSFPVIPENSYSESGDLHDIFTFLNKSGNLPRGSSWEKILRNFDRTILDRIASSPDKYRVYDFDYEE